MEEPEKADVETHSLGWRKLLLLPFLWDRATQLSSHPVFRELVPLLKKHSCPQNT